MCKFEAVKKPIRIKDRLVIKRPTRVDKKVEKKFMPSSPSVCEEATFTAIFNEYSSTLHNYLYYKTGNLSLAKDLTQEAFTRLWQHCQKVLFQSAKGFVFKTANNLMLNEISHKKVVLAFENKGGQQQKVDDPEFLLEQSEFKKKLEAAIAALPEKQRVVFLMSRIDKKTYKEIAATLGISKQAVEKRMYNALDTLRHISKLIR